MKPIIRIGIRVTARVRRRLFQSGRRILINPSMTIWPAKVLVIEEIKPVTKRAKANNQLINGLARVPTIWGFFSPKKTSSRLPRLAHERESSPKDKQKGVDR